MVSLLLTDILLPLYGSLVENLEAILYGLSYMALAIQLCLMLMQFLGSFA